MIFRLLDHISKRLSICRLKYGRLKKPNTPNSTPTSPYELEAKSLESFLDRIPQSLIAEAAIRSRTYARGLLHYENFFRQQREILAHSQLQPLYSEFQKIYAQLGDSDSLEGLASKLDAQTLEDKILGHEVGSRWSAAQTGYEVLLQRDPEQSKYQYGLLNCLQNMGHYESIIMYGKGLSKEGGAIDQTTSSHLIGASWRIQDWKCLAENLQKKHKHTMETDVGRILLLLHEKKYDAVETLLDEVKGTLINPLAAAGMESYQRSYEYVLQLSQLNEISQFTRSCLKNEGAILNSTLHQITTRWNQDLQCVNPSFRESFLTLQRILIGLIPLESSSIESSVKNHIGQLWLQTAKENRKIGHYQRAYSAILQAVDLKTEYAEVQQAKLLWVQNQQHEAMNELQLVVSRLEGGDSPGEEHLRKAKILLASWKEITGGIISSKLTNAYAKLTKEHPNWEKAQFLLGRFYNRIYEYDEKEKKKL